MSGEKSARRRGVILVMTATVLWSLAGVFARLLGHLDLWTVMGWRATLGSASISVIGIVEWRRGRMDESFGFGWLSPAVAALALIAISAYVAALMTTTVADVMIIYATLPFVAAGVGWLVNREAVSARTLIAGTIAFAGIAIMVGNALGSGRLAGEALSALMTVAFAGMVVLQRRRPGMIAVNAIGAFGAGLVGFALSPHPALGIYDMGVLFLFGLTTIGLAFVLFMEGAKFIPSAEPDSSACSTLCSDRCGCFLPSARTPAWPP